MLSDIGSLQMSNVLLRNAFISIACFLISVQSVGNDIRNGMQRKLSFSLDLKSFALNL